MSESTKKADLNEYLPRGARTKLANKHGVSKTLVGAVVRGQRLDHTDIYDDALLMVAAHRKQTTENKNKAVEHMQEAKKLGIAF